MPNNFVTLFLMLVVSDYIERFVKAVEVFNSGCLCVCAVYAMNADVSFMPVF